jgi:DNA polymerase I-like protein with 3'-5' exonuclease and polymerase domains/uracil-DNA glycosylase
MSNKHKVMFIVGYPKVNYIKENKDGSISSTYMDTTEGKYLRKILKDEFSKAGLNADDSVDIKVIFAYRKVPEILKDNQRVERIKYKVPTATAANVYKDEIFSDIRSYDPDIIIPLDGISAKPILGVSTMSKLQGQAVEADISGKNYWVMPSFSPQYALLKPGVEVFLLRAMNKVGSYLVNGQQALESDDAPSHVLHNDLEEVKEVFREVFKHGKTPEDPVSWDLETNSLKPDMDGSKVLTISLAWHNDDGTLSAGTTLPVNHPEYPWTEEEQKVVDGLISVFAKSSLWKVGHNIKFDMHQLRSVQDKSIRFKNTMDTMSAYYIAVSQEQKDSFGLKTMAHYYTPYANYEEPLEEYKAWFTKHLALLEKIENGKATIEDITYPENLTENERKVADHVAKKLLAQFNGKAKEVRTVDGNKFSYEWIPYSLLTKYAGTDALVTLITHDTLYNREIKGNEAWENLYTEHYPRLSDTLAVMETNGIQLDIGQLERIRDNDNKKKEHLLDLIRENEWVKQVEELHNKQYLEGLAEKAKKPAERDKDIYKYYTKYKDPEDRKFSPTSGDDTKLALFYFGGLELPLEKAYLTTKAFNALSSDYEVMYSDFSVGKETRDELSRRYPEVKLVKYLQEYSELSKIISTYTDTWIEQTDSRGVIHGRFNMLGTDTGRLSSSNPNL